MRLAERYRRLCNRRGQDGWSRIFGYPLARLLLIWLEPVRGLHPNHLTLASIAVRVAGALALGADRLLAGVALLQLGQVLDSMDGTLARARGQHSALGAFLDRAGDAASLGLLAGVIGWRATEVDGRAIWLAVALAGAFCHLLRGYMHWVARGLGGPHDPVDGARPAGDPPAPLREWLGGFPRLLLVGEADLTLWLSLAALLGAWREGAVLLGASQAVAALALVGFHAHRLRASPQGKPLDIVDGAR